MEVFRLSRQQFASTLSGKGAAIKGARWNSVGVEMIYTGASRALAMAEVAVHLALANLPSDYRMLTIFIPDNISLQVLPENLLPLNWNSFPHLPATQQIGDNFISEGSYAVLKVPSATVQGDHNFLINPAHSGFSRIKIIEDVAFPFDKRIFKG